MMMFQYVRNIYDNESWESEFFDELATESVPDADVGDDDMDDGTELEAEEVYIYT